MVNIKKFLEYSIGYRTQFFVLGGKGLFDAVTDKIVSPRENTKLLDIGCGPGHLVPWVRDMHYTGIDISQNYIASAKSRFGAHGQFICGDVNSVEIPSAPYDTIVAVGLLHHLSDDEVSRLAKRVRQLLKPGGKLITADGCYTSKQSRIAKFLLSQDRGDYVRREENYTQLVSPHFNSVKATLRDDLIHIPYTHLIMECFA